MRWAAARAASRRGSNMRSFLRSSQEAPSRASGTRVVFPAPGGAVSSALRPCANVRQRTGKTSSIGNVDMIGSVLQQAFEKARQLRARIVQTLNVPQGYASGLLSLLPCWTEFLNSLRVVREPSGTFLVPFSLVHNGISVFGVTVADLPDMRKGNG